MWEMITTIIMGGGTTGLLSIIMGVATAWLKGNQEEGMLRLELEILKEKNRAASQHIEHARAAMGEMVAGNVRTAAINAEAGLSGDSQFARNVRSLLRPGITTALILMSFWMSYEIIHAEEVSPHFASTAKWVFSLTDTVIGFWFGGRSYLPNHQK